MSLSWAAPTAHAKAEYSATHYVLTANDVDRNISEGRRFYTKDGKTPLDTKDAIKAALRRDGEVISR